MSIFPLLKTDECVQECDCIRLDASKSVLSKPYDFSQIKTVEIAPDGLTYITIKADGEKVYQKDWFLDWCYDSKTMVGATDGVISPLLRIEATDGQIFVSKPADVLIKTAEEDCLFTDDQDLLAEEHDILDWLPEGRSSYLYIHRRAKNRILNWIAEQGHRDCNGKKYTIEDVLDKEEFKEWSRFLSLRMIFNFISNAKGDLYVDKYKEYCKKEGQARTRMFSFDFDGDAIDDGPNDRVNLATGLMIKG